ncbi:MAG: hypothetical protein JNK82_02010 [Myxococcaceae bacterium]|nr:hypothetical protein [Myxococcaceae bacterium]
MMDLKTLTLEQLEARKSELEQSLSMLFAQVGAALPDLERELMAVRDELQRRRRRASP